MSAQDPCFLNIECFMLMISSLSVVAARTVDILRMVIFFFLPGAHYSAWHIPGSIITVHKVSTSPSLKRFHNNIKDVIFYKMIRVL